MARKSKHSHEELSSRAIAASRRLRRFQDFVPTFSSNWLADSFAIEHLESEFKIVCEVTEMDSCGPISFAALAGVKRSELSSYFPKQSDHNWTNRREMENAMRHFGWNFSRKADAWPEVGLCLIQWLGPWSQRGYPSKVLQQTHWVATIHGYVFDVNWMGWLPKKNWEEVVVEKLLRHHSSATGWQPMTSYEIGV